MTFAERKAALKAAGKTQQHIVRATGFSAVYVHECLKGTRENAVIRRAIARAIGRPLAEVYPESPAAVAV